MHVVCAGGHCKEVVHQEAATTAGHTAEALRLRLGTVGQQLTSVMTPSLSN